MSDEIITLQSRVEALQLRCAAVEADNARLRKALTHLLDDWERTATGFPQHIEMRYACRDAARAALEVK